MMQVRGAEVKVGDVIAALQGEWKVRTRTVDGDKQAVSVWLVSTDERWTTGLSFEWSAMVDVVSRCEHKTTMDDCCNGWCERCLDCGAVHL